MLVGMLNNALVLVGSRRSLATVTAQGVIIVAARVVQLGGPGPTAPPLARFVALEEAEHQRDADKVILGRTAVSNLLQAPASNCRSRSRRRWHGESNKRTSPSLCSRGGPRGRGEASKLAAASLNVFVAV